MLVKYSCAWDLSCCIDNIPMGFHWLKLIFPFQCVSIADILFRVGTLCSLLPFSAATVSGLNLLRLCVHCYSRCEFLCTSVLLCLLDTVFLELYITSNSSKLSASSTVCMYLRHEDDLMKAYHLGLSAPKSLTL